MISPISSLASWTVSAKVSGPSCRPQEIVIPPGASGNGEGLISIVTFLEPMVLSVIDMAVGVGWSGDRLGCGGPEFRGAPGGRLLGAGWAAGERERVERALDRVGGLVVLQGV